MTDDELKEMIESLRSAGTDVSSIEAKDASGGLPRSLRDTFSSFSNTAGGVIILGVSEKDGFTVIGLPNAAKLATDVANMASNEMEPALRPLIEILHFDGKQVVTIEVPELSPAEKPCYHKGAGVTRGSYVRVFDGDRQLTSYEVQLKLSSRGQPRDDEEPAVPYDSNVLNTSAVAAYCARLRRNKPNFVELDDLAVLRRTRVVVQHDNTDFVSIAGLFFRSGPFRRNVSHG